MGWGLRFSETRKESQKQKAFGFFTTALSMNSEMILMDSFQK
ncbi:hypothetical protein PSCFBP3800_04220 [Pseudomonas syringae group genomosp. 3]|uniref:Uncharacterized protein n=1 Tax=Pseudomonas syringae group genomosp. 3 TaxID=251701 RepID=A0A2K4WHT2_9PSED|nr:hypothetical protein CFBP6411_04092 [Pseudomonas syringae group genomosp. 3]SPF19676.1 hypothetical protein PSCFBP3800_04220 [Pseudomonas syringae group genomosp. 3]